MTTGFVAACGTEAETVAQAEEPTGRSSDTTASSEPAVSERDVRHALGFGDNDESDYGVPYLTDLLPNMTFRVANEDVGPARPLSVPGSIYRVVRGQVLAVSAGRGIEETYEGEGARTADPSAYAGRRETDFGDENAWWRTVVVTVEITDPLGGPLDEAVWGRPAESSQWTFEMVYQGGADAEPAVSTLGRVSDALVMAYTVPNATGLPVIARIIPVDEDGALLSDESIRPDVRFESMDEFVAFADGPGETLVLATEPDRGLIISNREPNS
ncbi:MAG: hypothetical protein ACK5PP_12675 [Acidimicrobiales bacterium]